MRFQRGLLRFWGEVFPAKTEFRISSLRAILASMLGRHSVAVRRGRTRSVKVYAMSKLNLILLRIVRWSSWPLLAVIPGFLITGYAMTGEFGCSRLLDEKNALTIHRMLHWPLIVLVVAHSVPAVYLALQRWGWIKQRQ